MARNATTKPEPETEPVATDIESLMKAEDSATEWETKVDESPTRVDMNAVGDVFIGYYKGLIHIPAENNISREHPEGEAFDLYAFQGVDGKPYSMGKTVKLDAGLADVPIGAKVRIEFVKEINTRSGLNPMKDFKVSVARS